MQPAALPVLAVTPADAIDASRRVLQLARDAWSKTRHATETCETPSPCIEIHIYPTIHGHKQFVRLFSETRQTVPMQCLPLEFQRLMSDCMAKRGGKTYFRHVRRLTPASHALIMSQFVFDNALANAPSGPLEHSQTWIKKEEPV